MNKKATQTRRNNHYRLLKRGQPRGSVRFNTSNTLSHEIGKFLLAWKLASEEHDFVTEAEFKDGGRADVLDLDTGVAMEVLHSETLDMVIAKTAIYPVDVIVVDSTGALIAHRTNNTWHRRTTT